MLWTCLQKVWKQLRIIPVLEYSEDIGWHYHAALEPPAHFNDEEFKSVVARCWSRVDWGDGIYVEPSWDREGLNTYMTKRRQKSKHEAWSDCIDWTNLFNPHDSHSKNRFLENRHL
jgi:hypothetical protein